MNTKTVLIVTPEYLYLPGRTIQPTPAGVFDGRLVGLVNRAAKSFRGEGVLALDSRAAARVGLPLEADEMPRADADAQPSRRADIAAEMLKTDGWEFPRLEPFTTLRATDGRATVHLLLLDTTSPARCPIIAPSYLDTATALGKFHELTGFAYRGENAGLAGMAILRDKVRINKTKDEPRWFLKNGVPGEDSQPERDYTEHDWKAPAKGRKKPPFVLLYDLNKMYLSAAARVPLTPYPLSHTGPNTPYDKKTAGFWLVELSPWQDDRLPDPAGYGSGQTRWVTGPTLDLLDDLTAEGVYGGYTVLDSYTGKGARDLLEGWSNTIRDALYALGQPKEGHTDDQAVYDALKATANRGIGLLNRKGGRAYRPDWHFAVIAQARANLFRKLRTAGEESGMWPLRIKTDCVWYGAKTDNHYTEAPKNFKVTAAGAVQRLGEFKPAGVLTPGGK